MDSDTEADVCCFLNSVISNLPASRRKPDEIRGVTLADSKLQAIVKMIRNGWPDHACTLHPSVRAYYHCRSELSECDGHIISGGGIVISLSMRGEIRTRMHERHQGLFKRKHRAQASVWSISRFEAKTGAM